MYCKKIQKWMVKDPLDLSGKKRDELREHIASCSSCRLRHERLQHLSKTIDELKAEKGPDTITRELWTRIRPQLCEPPKIRETGASPILRLAGYAAAAAVLLLAWIFIFQSDKKSLVLPEQGLALLDIVIESAQIDGKDAGISVFKMDEPEMTFIWLE